MHLERRRKRSNYKALALQYYLASVARRHRVVAMVVADNAGLLVAASMQGPESEELAAVAPLLMREDASGQTVADRHRLPIAIDPIDIDGSELFICAVGQEAGCAAGLDQARGGVERILSVPAV